jgi:lysophospholipase L1-like esterase
VVRRAFIALAMTATLLGVPVGVSECSHRCPMAPAVSVSTLADLNQMAPGTAEDPLDMLLIGDSITAGIGSQDGQGYRRPLTRMLNEAGVSHRYVSTNGYQGGWTVQHLREGIIGWLNAAGSVDLVIVSIGTNNAAGANGNMVGFEAAYIDLVNVILNWSPNIRVLLGLVAYSNNVAFSGKLPYVNEAVYHATWWDRNNPPRNRPAPGRTFMFSWEYMHPCEMNADGVHFNMQAYDKMGVEVYRGMTPIYNLRPTSYPPLPVLLRPGFGRPLKVECYKG